VTEWQYDVARPLLAERCDLVVWLDLFQWTVLRQVMIRTLAAARSSTAGTPRCGRSAGFSRVTWAQVGSTAQTAA